MILKNHYIIVVDIDDNMVRILFPTGISPGFFSGSESPVIIRGFFKKRKAKWKRKLFSKNLKYSRMQPSTMYRAHRAEATGKIVSKELVMEWPVEFAIVLPKMAVA